MVRCLYHLSGLTIFISYGCDRVYFGIAFVNLNAWRSLLFFFPFCFQCCKLQRNYFKIQSQFTGFGRSFTFVLESPKRIFLGIYWLVIICSSIMRFYKISKNSTLERILLRKYYHLVAVLMFVPALLVEVTIWFSF